VLEGGQVHRPAFAAGLAGHGELEERVPGDEPAVAVSGQQRVPVVHQFQPGGGAGGGDVAGQVDQEPVAAPRPGGDHGDPAGAQQHPDPGEHRGDPLDEPDPAAVGQVGRVLGPVAAREAGQRPVSVLDPVGLENSVTRCHLGPCPPNMCLMDLKMNTFNG